MSSRSPDLPAAFLAAPLAHRGLHDRAAGIVENSRAAFAAAIAAGYGIEMDIQRSADGEAMVFHDDEMPRLTGLPGLVRDYTAAQLGATPLLDGGETVPTLAEVLELVAGRAPLLIEVKDQDGALGPDVGPLETRVADLLAHYAGPVALMSFNPHSVAALAEAAPGRPRGLTTCAFDGADWSLPDYRRAELAALADAERTGAAFVSHDRRDLANPALARLKAEGLPILTWTIRSPAEEAAARPSPTTSPSKATARPSPHEPCPRRRRRLRPPPARRRHGPRHPPRLPRHPPPRPRLGAGSRAAGDARHRLGRHGMASRKAGDPLAPGRPASPCRAAALVLLFAGEAALAASLTGTRPLAWLAGFASPASWPGLAAQLLACFLPLLRRRAH